MKNITNAGKTVTKNTNNNKKPKNPCDKKAKNPYRKKISSISSFFPPVSKHNQNNHENQNHATLPVNNNHNNACKLHVPSDINSAIRGKYDTHAACIQSNHYNGYGTPCVYSNPHNRFTSSSANKKTNTNYFSSNLCANQNSAKRK